MQRLGYIDSCRGLAILLVVAIHLGQFFSGISNITSYGYLGVYLFFIISGFIIPYRLYIANYNYSVFKLFWIKRIIRIEIPYFFSVLITMIYLVFNNNLNFDLTTIVSNLTYTAPFFKREWLSGVYWTLGIEFQFYFFTSIFAPLIFLKNSFFFILFCIFLLLLSQFLIDGIFLSFWISFFILGFLLFRITVYKMNYYLFFALIPTLITIYLRFQLPGLVIGLLAFFLLSINFLKEILNSSKILINIGLISYSLYLLHVPILRLIYFFLRKTNLVKFEFYSILFSVIAIFLLSYIFYFFIEKPSKKLSSKIEYGFLNHFKLLILLFFAIPYFV